MMKKNKPIFNVCLRVFLPLLVVLTILLMLLTYLAIWRDCNDVSAADKELSESDVLTGGMLLQAKDSGEYYEVFDLSDGSGTIAFCVPENKLGEIPHMEGSYYPEAYWYGPYQIMDLSQGYEVLKDGFYWSGTDHLSRMTQVKVYDFSAYKGHTQTMGRGLGIALVFFWIAELVVGGILIFLDLIAGFIIFGINRSRKKNT